MRYYVGIFNGKVRGGAMFCPNCRAEYIEEIRECPDCGVTLVVNLPPEQAVIYPPRLKTITLIVLFATAYTFILRVTGTLVPMIFANLSLARATAALNLVAGLVLLAFFIFLRREYTGGNKKVLERAALFGIIGVSATIILDLKSLFSIFSENPNLASVGSRYLDIILPILSSFFIMIYFMIFKQGAESGVLKKNAFYAIVASIIIVITHLFTLVNYIYYGQFRWLSSFAVENMIIFLPIYLFVFVAYFLFFLAFYGKL